MIPTGKSYDLRSVEDFFQLTDDQRRRCLEDFYLWLTALEKLPPVDLGLIGVNVRLVKDVFTWHDDGKNDALFKATVVHK